MKRMYAMINDNRMDPPNFLNDLMREVENRKGKVQPSTLPKQESKPNLKKHWHQSIHKKEISSLFSTEKLSLSGVLDKKISILDMTKVTMVPIAHSSIPSPVVHLITPFTPSPVAHPSIRPVIPSQDASIKSLRELRIKNSPRLNLLEKIKRLLKRIFTFMTLKEKKWKKEINGLVQDVEKCFAKMNGKTQWVSRENKSYFEAFPDQKSLDLNAAYLDELRKTLGTALTELGKLTIEKKKQALELEERHESFTASLAEKIQNLEERVRHSESSVKILEKLMDVERAMIVLPSLVEKNDKKIKNVQLSQENWDRYLAVQNKIKDFVSTLREVFDKNEDLKKDKVFYKNINKKEPSLDEVQKIIQSKFPNLANYFDRLLNKFHKLETKKKGNLDRQVKILRRIFNDYDSVTKKINSLYFTIYGDSLFAKMKRKFVNLGDCKLEIKQLKREQSDFFAQMMKNMAFQPKELKWLKEGLDANKRNLFHTIEKAGKEIERIKDSHQMAKQLNQMMARLEYYFQQKNISKADPDLEKFCNFRAIEEVIAQAIFGVIKVGDKPLNQFLNAVSSKYPHLASQCQQIIKMMKADPELIMNLKLVISHLFEKQNMSTSTSGTSTSSVASPSLVMNTTSTPTVTIASSTSSASLAPLVSTVTSTTSSSLNPTAPTPIIASPADTSKDAKPQDQIIQTKNKSVDLSNLVSRMKFQNPALNKKSNPSQNKSSTSKKSPPQSHNNSPTKQKRGGMNEDVVGLASSITLQNHYKANHSEDEGTDTEDWSDSD